MILKNLHLMCCAAALLLPLCVGCASAPKRTETLTDWIENGQRRGTIKKIIEGGQQEWRYLDARGRVVRIEKRNLEGEPLAGALVQTFSWRDDGKLLEERFSTAAGKPAACRAGYVIRRYSYSTTDDGDRVVTTSYFSDENTPVCVNARYAICQNIYRGLGDDTRKVLLSDEQGKPASAVWDSVRGVARVEYHWLMGATPVRCGVYYGPDAKVVERRVLSGETHTVKTGYY